MKFVRELLSEKSAISTVRVLSLLSMCIAGGVAIYGVYRGTDLMGVAAVSGVFCTASMGGKVAQKSLEIKSNDAANKND